MHLLVAGEIEHLRARLAERLPDREQHRVAQPAADQHDGLAGFDFRRRAGRTHQDHRLARLQRRAQVGRAAHLQHDRRHQALLAVDPGAGERQAFHGQARAVAARAPASRSSAAGRTGPAGSARAAAGARTTTSTIVGVRRSTRTTVARSARSSAREERRRRSPRTPARPSRACATRSDSPASRSPSPSPRCRRTTDAGRRRSWSRGRRHGCPSARPDARAWRGRG